MAWQNRRWVSRSRQRNLKKLSPTYTYKERKNLQEEFAKHTPPPKSPVKNWTKKNSWERKNTPYGKYAVLLKKLHDAQEELDEFITAQNKLGMHIDEVERKAKEIEDFEIKQKEWEDERDRWAEHVWKIKVVDEDAKHVATTGRCCGENKYGATRGCSRRATQGNFCHQHYKMAADWRKQ